MMNALTFTEKDGIAHVVFDQPGHSANVFNQSLLTELEEMMTTLEEQASLRGVLFHTAKPSVFIAGADLTELQRLRDDDVIREVSLRGQELFDRIRALPCATVAVIHGAALGGGAEFALACSYRVASRAKATKIGFPETQLGILPAWGGCSYLPRLLGQAKALQLILGGKPLTAAKARRMGLVDVTGPRERLEDLAIDLLRRGIPERLRPRDTRFPLRSIIGRAALKKTMAKSGGHYPALPEALSVIQLASRRGTEAGLHAEREALVRLMHSEAFPHLVQLFFQREGAKKLRLCDHKPAPMQSCAVVGAGCMGGGIAQWLSARGKTVFMKDINPEAIGTGMKSVDRLYASAAKRRILSKTEAKSGADRVHPTLHKALPRRSELIIEAATERLDLKQALFAELEASANPDTILATNTSSLLLRDIGARMQNPQNLLGLHFFNPVSRMPLVEVVHSPNSPAERTDRLLRFVQDIGKTPVLVLDSPGFVVNRILIPYLMTAGFLLEHGADPLMLDKAMTDWGMPMGPVALMDQIGLAVCGHVLGTFADWQPERFEVPPVLAWITEDPKRAAAGFYRRQGKKTVPRDLWREQCSSTRFGTLHREQARDWMLAVLLREALLVKEEGIVSGPGDVDLAMVMGTGFAPFRGGPLCVGDRIGWKSVEQSLTEIGKEEARFLPDPVLQKFAASGAMVYDDPTRRAA